MTAFPCRRMRIENLLEGEPLAIGQAKIFWLLWTRTSRRKIDPRAWSTEALVEKIKDSIEGRDPLGEALVGEGFAVNHGAHQAFDVTL
jgi:hypothetical protein